MRSISRGDPQLCLHSPCSRCGSVQGALSSQVQVWSSFLTPVFGISREIQESYRSVGCCREPKVPQPGGGAAPHQPADNILTGAVLPVTCRHHHLPHVQSLHASTSKYEQGSYAHISVTMSATKPHISDRRQRVWTHRTTLFCAASRTAKCAGVMQTLPVSCAALQCHHCQRQTFDMNYEMCCSKRRVYKHNPLHQSSCCCLQA